MGSQLIEYFQWAGQTTTMHNYLTKNKAYSGLMWMWQPDRYSDQPVLKNEGFAFRNLALRPYNGDSTLPAASPPKYYFSCQIPLDCILNFAHDYKKVMIGVEHKLVLVRQSATNCMMRAATAGPAVNDVVANGIFPALRSTALIANAGFNVTLNITKFRWSMPFVVPNPSAAIPLGELIKESTPVNITFLNKKMAMIAVTAGATTFTWNPKMISGGVERARYIVIGFQCNRLVNSNTVQEVVANTAPGAAGGAVNVGNLATFSPGFQVNVIDAYVTVNGTRYPYTTLATDLSNNRYSKFYRSYLEFYNMYVGEYESDPCLSYHDFIAFNTLYVFDVSKQPPAVSNSTADIVVNFTFGGTGAPASTNVYIMCYHDSRFVASGANGDRQIVQIVSDITHV